MYEWIKDLFQEAAVTVAILSGIVAALRAVWEMRENRKQRIKEYRWRQANVAREILAEIHRSTLAMSAVQMMDWSEGRHEYEIAPGQKEVIAWAEVLATLSRPTAELTSAKERFIRDGFDWFLYFTDRVEHYIRTELIEFQDVAGVLKPYARKVLANKTAFDQLMRAQDYDLAEEFFRRYETQPRPA